MIRGARQNNLKNLDLDIATGELLVVTGVSGSGKSSLVFDTLYAEGQRRYVETFSAYARQFLDRMDKPQVDRIEGVPPAIAIDQTNPVRTSRSTVGTMTELNDHLKLLFARTATLHCRQCAQPVRRDSSESIIASLRRRCAALADPPLIVCFEITVPANFSEAEIEQHLQVQGFTKRHLPASLNSPVISTVNGNVKETANASVKAGGNISATASSLFVIVDRFRMASVEASRLGDAIESALQRGQGKLLVFAQVAAGEQIWRYSTDLTCADCNISYTDMTPRLFSFNSPVGACDKCRGFGRIIGVDLGLVVPDDRKSLAEGAVKPWQTESFKECQAELLKYAGPADVATDVPWRELSDQQRQWVIDGGRDWTGNWKKQWYGVHRFFDWLESKAYKMHIRVLLSRYRSYTPCETCMGARLKPDALLWRSGTRAQADASLGRYRRFLPAAVQWSDAALLTTAGLTIHDLMLLPIDQVTDFFDRFDVAMGGSALDEATAMLLTDIRARLSFLKQVGLGYLTLDRQSRTLSGGEVQRINLTTALGTSLVNTLFVLDEPSIGLHPRDMTRIVDVMKRLRDAGNTLVVVEHDPQVMLAADKLLDIGPGPGERGGEIVYYGAAAAAAHALTLTGDYLAGRRMVDSSRHLPVPANCPRLIIQGATEHNLKNIDVAIPLGRFVTITGVSGSGKSTLMQDVLLPALQKHFRKGTETVTIAARILGAEMIGDVAFVDQSQIGKTTRSNPVSYIGAFDVIRKRFAALERSIERGYTASTFSFNAGDGRCPTCGGNGFEHVEMQFLSDVYLRCADCDGKRFRPDVLEVRWDQSANADGLSIADVLDLTVREALTRFAVDRELTVLLQPLVDVGLDYVKLGQPVPTLSGGEAQRLKLAGFLAQVANRTVSQISKSALSKGRGGTLFMFDEPTTGLHFDDIAKLLGALRKLIAAGHSVLLIEHNLDVIAASDWIIDLGPEGGDAGGQLVAAGTPEDIARVASSHTGAALNDYRLGLHRLRQAAQTVAPYDAGVPLQSVVREKALHSIFVQRAREHNLQNIDVTVPREKMTVITGVSGSGKSTLAFDVIFGEGQRRYLESLNAYARQFVQPSTRPDVDGIYGIPPTVAIEQRTSRGGRKSTVATQTEIYHFLRLLYVKLGKQFCPTCNVAIEPQSYEMLVQALLREYRNERIALLAPLVVARKGVYTDLAKWANGKGYTHLRIDREFIPTDPFPRIDRYIEHDIELPVGDLMVKPENEARLRSLLRQALDYGKGVVLVGSGLYKLEQAIAAGDLRGTSAPLDTRIFSTHRVCPSCGTNFAELDPRLFSFNSKLGWCQSCFGTGAQLDGFDAEQTGEEDKWNPSEGTEVTKSVGRPATADLSAANARTAKAKTAGAKAAGALTAGAKTAVTLEVGDQTTACLSCNGHRLNPIALAVRFNDLSITDTTALPIADCAGWVDRLQLTGRSAEIAAGIISEIGSRLRFLQDVGLGYLTLDRAAPTLSGGEAQRIRLAAQLGSNLQGVCYVLDEPTIGLHPRDNQILLDTLDKLKLKGNTMLVVEHDEETIRRADHLIDIGPGAGRLGGHIVATGDYQSILANPASLTGRLLANPLQHPLQARRPFASAELIKISGADSHNLKKQTITIPLGRITVITGVSGSGKSTLARDVLMPNLARLVSARNNRQATPELTGCKQISGWQRIGRVLEVDQTPIGKTPRSCPATYVGFWDSIRRLFADAAEARLRGYNASRFSFNTGAGRCDGCEGQGMQRIEMSFLPDVRVRCDVCHGKRFNRETLAVTMRGKSIGDVLEMNVDEAVEYFSAHGSIQHPLKLLQQVGLGYLTLGQPSPTLSGGEAQRLKLVTELAKVRDLTAPENTASDGDAGTSLRRARVLGQIPHTLYVLDEPTVGLHMADVEKLLRVMHRLVDAGNTLVVVEHNIDIWREADWIIDLGPDGGRDGGMIVATGTPEQLALRAQTHTEKVLAEHSLGPSMEAASLTPALTAVATSVQSSVATSVQSSVATSVQSSDPSSIEQAIEAAIAAS